jgi:glycosyltransferase involved in cell wall biosynthesis
MNIVVRAPLLSVSGYGQHSRQIFEALQNIPNVNIATQVVQWGNTSWYINPDDENGLIGQIMSKTSDKNEGHDVSFQVQLPDEWSTTLARFNVGVTAAVETDRCNPAWVDKCNQMNAIIVPSIFTKSVLEKSGDVKVPIHVIGEWYIDEINEKVEPIDISFKTSFNFLIVSQLTSPDSEVDRKNITNTLKWICETFKDDPTVGIILKTNSGRGTDIDRHITESALRQVISQIRSTSKVPIYLIHGNMSNREIASLYRHPSIKALVSLTRGEGFGLPILEAAASALPVIATDWSAHTEFLNLGKWIKIESQNIKIPDIRVDNRIFVNGVTWANPSEENFKKKIRKFRESHITPKEWAEDLSIKCKNSYSKAALIKKYLSLFETLFSNV